MVYLNAIQPVTCDVENASPVSRGCKMDIVVPSKRRYRIALSTQAVLVLNS